MKIETDDFSHRHILHEVDGDLTYLHSLLLDMSELLKYQLEEASHAFDYGDADVALKVVSRDRKLSCFQNKIDNEALAAIARYSPVATDLRTVISSMKIAVEFRRFGGEIRDFAELAAVLFDPCGSCLDQEYPEDIIKAAGRIKIMLNKTMAVLETWDSKPAYGVLKYERECGADLLAGIKQQLAFAPRDAGMLKHTLDIMEMLKTLERCGEHCRNIAEYSIFMIDGIDVRHGGEVAMADFGGNPAG